MKTLKSALALSFLMILFLTGCRSGAGNQEDPIPADVVNNPNSASGQSTGTLPVITFEDTEHDFGKILEGETVNYSFQFTNTGKSDLLIAEVTSSCGCTVPSYPKNPIRPGSKGEIKVAFNSNGKRGFQSKSILVATNTQPNTTVIHIKAQVVNPEAEGK
ncbi:MAG TPA: DUF1573 domain-containing protein [Bacteroidales bacterium]|nr:DUF1573 domain-containing protein [Bacteroidales bacterium]HPS62470.1 DUF1573 domain-containing protein [Bacteroidales bacterium]